MRTVGLNLPVIDNLQRLFVSDVALLDIRAPIEFEQGAFPTSQNHPLMDDVDREIIGTCYKQCGQNAAIELGLTRVSGDTKNNRMLAWQQFIQRHPDGVLYCFRGGLRSRIAQQWLYEATGIAYPRVQGGYKAMRRFLLEQLETLPRCITPLIVTGRTGTGKTRLLTSLPQHVDLEGFAKHRGSAFGAHPVKQPTQITFENTLAIHLLRQVQAGYSRLVMEDEGRRIGSLHIPETVFECMQTAPLVLVQESLESRIELILNDYVVKNLHDFQHNEGCVDKGFNVFHQYLVNSLAKIERRLGGVRYKTVSHMLGDALNAHRATGTVALHRVWIEQLLREYYDPMYDFQIAKKRERILFSGSQNEIEEYVRHWGASY